MSDLTSVEQQNDGAGSDLGYLAELLPYLERLDKLLERAVSKAPEWYGPEAASDRYRGLYISPREAERLLARRPGVPLFAAAQNVNGAPADSTPATGGTRLDWLADAFHLQPFDVDILLIALAPELDRRYERLYAYLQDHVAYRRATVDLVLNLLCANAGERLAHRAHFDPEAPLFRSHMVHLLPPSDQEEPGLLAHNLKVDPQILRFILHQDGLDPRLASYCRLEGSELDLDDLPLDAATRQSLSTIFNEAWNSRQPLLTYFSGPTSAGKRQTAGALATDAGAYLLVVDLAQVSGADLQRKEFWSLLLRTAWFENAILYLDGVDALLDAENLLVRTRMFESLAWYGTITVMAGTRPWTSIDEDSVAVVPVSFGIPDYEQRRSWWRRQLAATGIQCTDRDADALASRFRLTSGEIDAAVRLAGNAAHWRAAGNATGLPTTDTELTLADLYTGARAQSSQDLAALAQKLTPKYVWADLVLPPDALAQLHEICQRVSNRERVMTEWGFDAKLSLGKGTSVLFAGPSGTGKTMAAEVIANDLGLDLYRIDLASVVSKYIGETEKNLDRIFTAAENANAILFFDEADALFGKRSEVRDSHDRYANIEVSYLLQKMEQYDGIGILATNLRSNIDEAFVRRLAFIVHFAFPDEASRRKIWSVVWPSATPLVDDIDFDYLAREFKLSGGSIKNIALTAAFFAAEDGGVVAMIHLARSTNREFQKLGKSLGAVTLGTLALTES